MNDNNNIKLITIVGPTATGKTNLAVTIANRIDSEIISADSRQIYKGMDIGTGKDLNEYKINNKSIPYHLIDIIHPNEDYSVYSFQKDFHITYNDILTKNKCPILCGGTGLYIESVLLNYKMSSIKPDYALRNKLEKLSKNKLHDMFQDLNNKVPNNWKCDTKQRIIRGIEIALKNNQNIKSTKYELDLNKVIVIGIHIDIEKRRKKITQRLQYRLSNGMIEEVEKLLDGGLSPDRLNYFGLEYKFIGQYFSGKVNKNDLFQKLNSAIHRYAKRQMTFFRRMEKRGIKINWLESPDIQHALKIIHQHSK